jgi:hypothetical protein
VARQVKIATGKSGVVLPNGGTYKGGDVVTLKDEEFARIDPNTIPTYLIDEGFINDYAGAAVHAAAGKQAVVLPSGQTINAAVHSKAYLTPEQLGLVKTSLFPTYVVNDDDKLAFISMEIPLATIANGTVRSITPGLAGTIVGFDVEITVPATTAAKTTTLSLSIGATPVTGGSLVLTSALATPAGKVTSATAITAANVFTATNVINLIAASTTAFVEGTGLFRILIIKA